MPRYMPEQQIYGGNPTRPLPLLDIGGGRGTFRSSRENECPQGYTWDAFQNKCVSIGAPTTNNRSGPLPVPVNMAPQALQNRHSYPRGGYAGTGMTQEQYNVLQEQRASRREGRRLSLEEELGRGQLREQTAQRIADQEMQQARLALEREVARGNLTIAEANQKLQDFMTKENLRLQERMGLQQYGLEKELGRGKLNIEQGYLDEAIASRKARERWQQELLNEILGYMGEGTSDNINWDTLEERMYMPAQRAIESQMRQGLSTIGGQAAGAGYGGRSSWEDREAARILGEGSRAIGDVRSEAGIQTTRARLEERDRQRQQQIALASMLASLGG